ncbi:hypothetical protein KFE25_013026 [Diacronema lutheri]|uniref:SET domain-containing protein n=1 Tax=Diacronema lutheri TaxID=2081491 RepID=A0A8J5XA51_DIALT|nr:hypothetical protein KFE25_013026 [Diacronema lutheri]
MSHGARAAFEAWLRARGVWWDPRIRLVAPGEEDTGAVAHGWGVVALGPVRPGEVLFKIPRRACFGVRRARRALPGRRAAEEVDSQAEIVALLLRERELGARSRWAPLLATLPADVPTPWRWTAGEQAWLRGTELERPLALKRARLEREYARACTTGAHRGASLDEWCACSAVVISHVNPWWGGCVAPFACMLNAPHVHAGEQAGVAYELAPDGRALVGVALTRLRAGVEVTQSYGLASVADLIYKYGFCFEQPSSPSPRGAPRPSDVVSVRADDMRDVARAIARGGWLDAIGTRDRAEHACAAGTWGGRPLSGSRGAKRRRGGAADVAREEVCGGAIDASLLAAAQELAPTLNARLRLLARVCALQPCPWDGLHDERTVELALCADWAGLCAQSASAHWRREARAPAVPPGLHELLVAVDVLLGLHDAEWRLVSARVASSEDARAPQPLWRDAALKAGLDADDCAAIALAAALSALRVGEWPPPAHLEATLANRLCAARAACEDGDGDDGSSSSDGDEDDEPLWEALAPAAPSAAPGFAFTSPLAVRGAQAVVEWLRFRSFSARRQGADPLEGGVAGHLSHPLTSMTVETLHAVELSVLHGCALTLDYYAQREPTAALSGHSADDDAGDASCMAAWRRLHVSLPS